MNRSVPQRVSSAWPSCFPVASATTYTVTSTVRHRPRVPPSGDSRRQRQPRTRHDRVQHHRIGRAHDRPGDSPSPDHGRRDDRRLHAAGLLAQHERGRARAEHGSADRDRRHRNGRQRSRGTHARRDLPGPRGEPVLPVPGRREPFLLAHRAHRRRLLPRDQSRRAPGVFRRRRDRELQPESRASEV